MSESNELARLSAMAESLSDEIEQMQDNYDEARKALVKKRKELHELRKQIKSERQKEPSVSDHAIVRYMERVLGIDTEAIRAAILSDKNRRMIEFAGNCRIKSDGVDFVVKDCTVVTVVN